MSLFDTDKSSEDRGAPIPNHTDLVVNGAVKAHGTTSVNYTTDATTAPSGGTNTGTVGGGATVQMGFKRLVGSCQVGIFNDGSTITTATVAHNLPFVPVVEAAIENANITIASGTATGASLPLPIFSSAAISGGNVNFTSYLYAFADATNMYVNFLNATGLSKSVTVTCYLYQRTTG